jgi:hypothetical protein
VARPSELIPGNCYFMVNFYESRPPLVVPAVHTYLFVGRETHDGQPVWIFREPPGPHLEGSADDDREEEVLIAFEDRSLYQILDLRGLIRELTGLTDFHPLVKPTEPSPAPARREMFHELAPEIERLLHSDEWSAVTITIKYTDDGFSITIASDQQVEWSFNLHVKLEADLEARVRAIFRESQVPSTDDYLYNAGQKRVLTYRLPRDEATTIALCGRLLREVYEMRDDDELAFSFRPKRAEKSG